MLNTLTAHVAGDGGILTLAGDLVDLINIDDADPSLLDVEVRGLDELEQDVLDVLAHIAGLRQCRRIRDGKRHVQNFRQRLSEVCFTDARRAQHQNIALLDFNAGVFTKINPFIVVVDRNGKRKLRVVLTNDILIQGLLYLSRRRQGSRRLVLFRRRRDVIVLKNCLISFHEFEFFSSWVRKYFS